MLLLLGYAAAGLATSCGAAPDPAEGQGSPTIRELAQGSFLLLEVRSDHHWSRLGDPDRGELELGALFVHYWGSEREDVARLLGVRLEEPTVTPGTCVTSEGFRALPLGSFEEDLSQLSVELMDAGPLLVTLPDRSELLWSELYPEVLPAVSGRHYHRIIPLGSSSISIRSVGVLGLGGRDVVPFELEDLRGPQELRIQSVGGWHPDDDPPVGSAASPLSLSWAPGQPRFHTLVRLRWGASLSGPAGELVCRPRGSGRMTIGTPILRRITLAGRSREVTLSVESTAWTRLPGPLRGGAVVRLVQSDSLTLRLTR